MTEKKGFTGQLRYEFDTSKNLEILLPSNKWHRVIPNEFRSFNGKRRITTYLKNDPIYSDYNGPIYLFKTNQIIKNPTKQGLQYINDELPISKPRLFEKLS
jgi:hypothetical protein